MLGHIVLKKKNIPELESLIVSLKSLPGDDIELNVDAGFFDRDNPIFTKPEKVKAAKVSGKDEVAAEAARIPRDELRKQIRAGMAACKMGGEVLSLKLGKSRGYIHKFLSGNGYAAFNLPAETATRALAILDEESGGNDARLKLNSVDNRLFITQKINEAGSTVRETADKMGISESSLKDYLLGKRNLTKTHIGLINKALAAAA